MAEIWLTWINFEHSIYLIACWYGVKTTWDSNVVFLLISIISPNLSSHKITLYKGGQVTTSVDIAWKLNFINTRSKMQLGQGSARPGVSPGGGFVNVYQHSWLMTTKVDQESFCKFQRPDSGRVLWWHCDMANVGYHQNRTIVRCPVSSGWCLNPSGVRRLLARCCLRAQDLLWTGWPSSTLA